MQNNTHFCIPLVQRMKSNALKWILPVICFIVFGNKVFAQIPATCFEIESILVDACGNPEGENEMVRFVVGPNDLNVSNLTVDWPNNNFIGICQNATTASKVIALNTTVQACGIILEPVNGILPSGKKVLLVTSENMDPAFNSFAGLADTLYMIFQCAGNTAGHFKNYSPGSGTRTLIMDFGAGCGDTVTYAVDSLIDQLGFHNAQDGATVNFTWPGFDSYINTGCQAPIIPLSVSLTASVDTLCAGDTIQLTATINSGNINSVFWTGGSGIFSNPVGFNIDYYSNIGFTGTDTLVFGVIGSCNDTLYDTLFVQINSGGNVLLNPSGPYTFCQGDSVVVSVSGGSSFQWSTGATTSSITIFASGAFSVTATGACGSATTGFVVQVLADSLASLTTSGPTTFCQGDSVTLNALAGITFLWSNGSTLSGITVFTSGTYTVSVTGNCGTTTLSQLVSVIIPPSINVIPGSAVLCPGSSLTLTASGGNNYLWSSGSSLNPITVDTGGIYSVISSNGCGSDTAFVTISLSSLQVAFSADPDTGMAPLLVQFTNQSQPAIQYTWDFKDGNGSNFTDPVHSFISPGTYLVTLVGEDGNGCLDTAFLSIYVKEDSINLVIPNVFTPNEDGLNTYFNVKGAGLKSVSGTIYSRWGAEINSWNSLQEGWNGRFKNGGEASAGTYFYILKVTQNNGKENVYHGFLNLIR